MFTRTTALTPSELKSAIVRAPLIVKPDTTVISAIAHMSGLRTLCEATKTVDGQLDELHLEVRSSCVLVVEDGQLLGILTERDVVRLSAEQRALEKLTIREVMIHPVVTLHESGFTDLFFGINLLQQYRIRHLPILDEQERVVGLVTHESLRQTSRPVDLLRLRVVSEVMTRQVICAVPNSSMLAIAQLMAQHHVSSVMIIQTCDSQAEPRQIPVGIITERDIVQFQALGLNLTTCLAQTVMSTPIFSVKPNDSLWVVQQIMEQRLIRRLAVTGEQGEILGIVTQTSLLQALNPLELYKLAEVLEEKVVRLEAEKIELLETRTIELEQQVEARTIALQAKAEREQLVLEIATQIRSSLSLQTILDTTVKQVQQLLGCDRVNIWQFEADWQTVVVAESTDSSLSLVGQRIDDTCFKQQQVEKYRLGYILIVPDIYKAQMSDCHRQMLIGLQTRSKILVPLLCGEELWGLLNVTESQHAREWQPEEVELLQALSVQLAIAILQATTHQKLQEQLSERQQAEARLRESEQRYVTLTAAAPVGIFRTDAEGNSIYINQWCCQILGLPPEATTTNGWQQALHPDDRENVIAETIRARQENRPFQQEYRILRPDGNVIWVLGRAVAERDAHGQTISYVGTITDISDRKRTELTLQKLVTGTAAVTGDDFFPALVRHIAEALDIGYAIVTELVGDQLHTLGFWSNGALQPEISYHPANTPCEYALRNGEFYCESQVQRIFPDDLDLVMMQADSYLGISLKDDLGNAIGNLCILDMQPLPAEQRTEAIAILQVFAARAAAELQRKRANDALHHLNQDLEARVEQRTIELQAREAQLRDLFDNATDMIQSVSPDGRILFVNTAWKETLGYSDAELEHLSIFHVIHPDELLHCQTAMQSLFAGALCLDIETRFLTKDGRQIAVEGNVNCQLKDGIPIATRGIFRDITQRKQAENALRESQQFLQTVLDTFPLFVFWKNRESVYLGCNQNFAIAAGVASPAEIIGKTDYDLSWGTTEADLYRADDRQFMDSGTAKLGIIETQYQANGITKWVETNKVPLRDLKGELIGILGTYQDITDRKLLEEQLVCSENKMRSIFESITDIILTINFQGQKIASIDIPPISNSLINTLYIEIVNQTTNVLLLDSSNNDWLQRVLEVINSGKATQFDYSLTIGASLLWFSAVVSPINTTAVTWVARDISDRKRAEAELEKLSERLALSLKSGAIGSWEWDIKQNTILWDERMYELYGVTKQSDSHLVYDIWVNGLHPDDRIPTETLLQQAVLGQAEYDTEFRVVHPDGSIHFINAYGVLVRDSQGNPQSMIGVNFDISDRKQAEQTIRQQAERETLLREISQRIRQSLDLQTIFDTACHEIRQVLQADRVGIFKFDPESHFDDGEFVAESVVERFPSVMAIRVHDHCFGENYSSLYAKGRSYVVEDIYNGGMTVCHTNILAQFQVRANLIVPLLCGNELWGLLCIHQCGTTRRWQHSEVEFTQQLANQLAIAIQQVNLYEQIQSELLVREQAEARIALQLRRQETLGAIVQHIRESLNINEILTTVTQQVKDLLHGDRVIVFRVSSDGRSQIVEEAVSSEFPALKDRHWDDEVWSQEILDCYWQGKPRIVPDVMNDIWTHCLVEYSIEGQIQSKIVAPILQEVHGIEIHRWVAPWQKNKLWGVLVVHACGEKRVWKDSEAQLLQQIANQLAIAIQQASLFEQLQKELAERQQAEAMLTESNQQLAVSNQELARATRLKDEFLANMSHELRTPLNAILGMTEGLQEGVFGIVNEKQIKALQTVERSGSHLLELINDILDVAKIEAGQVELECTSISVSHLCQSSLAFIKQQSLKKRIQLEIKLQLNLPDLLVDERRIRQVLINLLNNAVKFTPEGGRITLEVSQPPQLPPDLTATDSSLQNFLRIAVIDTGIGITPENIQKLFQPFVQIDSALNRQYAGTGLGLALVKRIVELHGGRVELTSELGRGSCFAIELPCTLSSSLSPEMIADDRPATTSELDSPPASEATSQAPLILLAEDNEANISTVSSYLGAKGYRILLAKNGQAAIDMATTHQPNLILMDIQMPGMDGLEAMRQIRLDRNLVEIPIVALTALAMTSDRDRCLEAGANYYLTKPVKLKQLVTTIQQLLVETQDRE